MMFRFRCFSYIFIFLFAVSVCGAPAFSFTHDCRRPANEKSKTEQGNRIMELIPLMLLLLSLFDQHNDSIGETSSETIVEEIDVPAEIDWDSLCAEHGLVPKGSGGGSGDGTDDQTPTGTTDDGTSDKTSTGTTDSDGTDDTTTGQTGTETTDVCDNNSTLCDEDLSSISRAQKTVVGWTDSLNADGAFLSTAEADATRFNETLDQRIVSTVVTGELIGQQAETIARATGTTRAKVSEVARSTRTIAQGKQNEAAVGALEMETLAVNNELAGNELLLQSLVSAKKYRHILGGAASAVQQQTAP